MALSYKKGETLFLWIPFYQSGTKPNLVAKILATNIGNRYA